MARIDLNHITYEDLNNKDRRIKIFSRLRTCSNEELREKGFQKLIDFYLKNGNFGMAGYCYDNLGPDYMPDACKLYAKQAVKLICNGRIGKKRLSDIEFHIDISLSCPNKIDKRDLKTIEEFLKLNQNIDNHIPHMYNKVRRIKAKAKK